MKEMIKKNIITVLCVISIVVLALPLIKVSVSMDIMGYGGESEQSVTGFSALKASFLGIVLFVGPILLVAMNYIKQLDPHKKQLAIAVPAICLIALIIVILQAKSYLVNVSGGGEGFSVDVEYSIGLGAILAALSYIATAIAGAVTYHGLTLDKAGLEQLKNSSAALLSNVQETAAHAVESATHAAETVKASVEGAVQNTAPSNPAPAKKSANIHRTEEILSLIQKLAAMKDSGVLTEEEFSEKKKALLDEIG